MSDRLLGQSHGPPPQSRHAPRDVPAHEYGGERSQHPPKGVLKQIRQLLDVVAVVHPVSMEDGAEIPEHCAEPCAFFPELRYTITQYPSPPQPAVQQDTSASTFLEAPASARGAASGSAAGRMGKQPPGHPSCSQNAHDEKGDGEAAGMVSELAEPPR